MKQQTKRTVDTDYYNFPLPANVEAERAVIGAILTEQEALYDVIDLLKGDMFTDAKLSKIYAAVLSVEAHSRVDIVTVSEELQKSGNNGEIHLIADIATEIASAAHVREYAMIVYQNYLRRKFILQCLQSLNNAKDGSIDVADLISSHIFDMENLTNTVEINPMVKIGKVAAEAMKEYQERAKKAKEGMAPGLHTGLIKLDRTLHGLQKGCVYIIAARPGMGKTAFMLNIARKTAQQGNAVAIFSLEMTRRSLIDRMTIAASGINSNDYKDGRSTPEEVYAAGKAMEELSALPISINDTALISIQQIKAQAKKLKRKNECDVILIDYLQLIDTQTFKAGTKNDETAALSRAVKVLARDLDVPVILLSQLNRGVEQRSDKIPMLSDLRDSGAIEQDADTVLFIHRESYYDAKADKNTGFIRVAKNRDGKTGDIKIHISSDITDFRDLDETANYNNRNSIPEYPDYRDNPDDDNMPF